MSDNYELNNTLYIGSKREYGPQTESGSFFVGIEKNYDMKNDRWKVTINKKVRMFNSYDDAREWLGEFGFYPNGGVKR